jgi:hypothetical protein
MFGWLRRGHSETERRAVVINSVAPPSLDIEQLGELLRIIGEEGVHHEPRRRPRPPDLFARRREAPRLR